MPRKEFLERKIRENPDFHGSLVQSFFHNSLIGQAFTLSSGELIANQAMSAMFGYTADEFSVLKWSDLTHPDDIDQSQQLIQDIETGKTSGGRIVKRYLRKDGSVFWAEAYVSQYTNPETRTSNNLTTIIDITLRVEYEQEAEHQHEFLKKMAESNRIVTECMTKDFKNMQEQIDFALTEALHLTESECGCILTYDESSTQFELLAHYGRDSNCRIREGIEKQFTLVQAGFWGESIRQRKTLVHEQPFSNDMSASLPFEHVPLNNLMTLPMFDLDKIVAVVGFANKETGFSEHDVAAITSLMNGVWMAVNKRLQERRTARLLERMEAMFNNHEAVMLLLDANTGKVLDANPAALDFYGYTREEILQKHMYEINAQGKEASEKLRLSSLQSKRNRFVVQHKLKSGEIRYVDLFSCPIPYGGETRLFTILFDITEQIKATKQIEYLAYHDHLTGVYNRRSFEETFRKLAESGEHYPLGVIMGDINGLKLFNDAFGHLKGDEAIHSLVQELQTKLEPDQHLARIGGDEFAIIVPATNEAELKKLVKQLEMLFHEDDRSVELRSLSISFGYSIQHNKEQDLDWLLKESEAFMYNRKYYSSRSFRSSAINAIMETLFTKCEREKVHAEKVSQFSEMIANSLGLDRMMIDKIRVAGMLHDIGKIGIDESILNKPGKLTPEEWEIMKLHSAKGAKILSNTVEFHQIAEWVLAHHEQIDGKGYPNQLPGHEIPLASRIISVADAYAAMTSPRPYREAMTRDEAVSELKRGAGTHWDASLVEILLKLV